MKWQVFIIDDNLLFEIRAKMQMMDLYLYLIPPLNVIPFDEQSITIIC